MTSNIRTAIGPPSGSVSADLAGALSVRANTAWTLSGSVTQAFARWVMLLVMARLGGPVMVGQFALALAIVEPVMMFSDLQLRGVLATDARGDYRFTHYLTLRLTMCVVAVLVVAAIAFATGHPAHGAAVIVAVVLWRSMTSISDIFYGLFQRHEMLNRAARSIIARSVLAVLALGAALFMTGDLLWAVAGLFGVGALILLGHDVPVAGRLFAGHRAVLLPVWDMTAIPRLAIFAVPLGVAVLFSSLGQNVPRYVMESEFGPGALGVLAAMVYLVEVGAIAVAAIAVPVTPRLSRLYALGDAPAFWAGLLKLIAVGAALGAAVVTLALLAGREVLSFVYRPDFAQNADVFVWIAVAGGIGYVASMLGYSVTATRQYKHFVVPYGAISAVSAGVSLLLIPRYGMLGAAWTLCLVNTAACVAPAYILVRKGPR